MVNNGSAPKFGSFDAGYAGLLTKTIGLKRAKEIRFVPLGELEAETVQLCREMLALSPLAPRMRNAGINAADDGRAGVQQLAGDETLLFYTSEEAREGRDASLEKRRPDFSHFPRRP